MSGVSVAAYGQTIVLNTVNKLNNGRYFKLNCYQNNMPSPFPPQLIQALRNASSITVLTGAGISAESGVPTFRDP